MASNNPSRTDNLMIIGTTSKGQVDNLTTIGTTSKGQADNLTTIGATGNSHAEYLTIIGTPYNSDKVDVEEAIHKQTLSDIDVWTEDAVETAALNKVLEKIQTGSACVTIMGSPGDFKSTFSFWALRRPVYKVSSEQFDQIIKTSAPVMLLDDVFGQTMSNEAAWEVEKALNGLWK